MKNTKTTTKSKTKTTKDEKAKTSVSEKSELLDKYKIHKTDTGSIQVQIALLTDRIGNLGDHLKDHHTDNDSRRGILLLVGKRRKLLNYLSKADIKAYEKLIKDLGLRK